MVRSTIYQQGELPLPLLRNDFGASSKYLGHPLRLGTEMHSTLTPPYTCQERISRLAADWSGGLPLRSH